MNEVTPTGEGAASAEPAGRTVDAGRGVAWWTDAWALFVKSAALWVVLALILIIIMIALNFIPFLGAVVAALILPVFAGSMMLAARKLEGGGTLEAGDLFTCFQGDKLTPLLVLGALLLGFIIAIGVVGGVLGMGALFGMWAGGARHGMGGFMAAMGMSMLALLVMLVLGFVATMAIWFAPALVVFRNTAPLDALKASFAASLKNIVPFLLWGLIYIVASIVASIPFMLGWIVLAPVVMLTAYVSYKDVFGN